MELWGLEIEMRRRGKVWAEVDLSWDESWRAFWAEDRECGEWTFGEGCANLLLKHWPLSMIF